MESDARKPPPSGAARWHGRAEPDKGKQRIHSHEVGVRQQMRRSAAVTLLRIVGGLLIILGFVHLAATPHIPQLLYGSPRAVYEQAVPPTLLNHVLVGILLLPLGYTTWLAALAAERREIWAKRVLVVNTVAVFSLPLAVAIFMRRPEYYRAPLFLTGVGLTAVISLFMAAAVWTLASPPKPENK